tara:strand:- start:46 stop:486 length:441 start_codon:yes stop_codon:yes gene_type:complete
MNGGKLAVGFLALLLVSGCLGSDSDETLENTEPRVLEPSSEPQAVYGCMDKNAVNYDSNATEPDNSSCLYDSDGDGTVDSEEIPGCTDETAENYDSNATEEDGSCTYPEEEKDCPDSDGDGVCAEEDACDDNPDASTEDECETEDL